MVKKAEMELFQVVTDYRGELKILPDIYDGD